MKQIQPKHGRLWLYVLLLIAATGTMTGLRECRGSGMSGASYSDTIIVGIQYAPMSFYMYDDTLGGFDYDLLRLISRDNGVKFKFTPITSAREGLLGLKAGRYDMVAADIPMTAALRDSFLLTEPAYLDRQVLVQLTDSTGAAPHITSALQLRGDSVWIAAGSPVRNRIEHLSEELGDTIYINESASTPEQLLIRTAMGDIPRAVINEHTARAMTGDYPLIDISTSISFTQFQPWVIAPGNRKLLDRMDLWLTKTKAMPEYQALLSRYMIR